MTTRIYDFCHSRLAILLSVKLHIFQPSQTAVRACQRIVTLLLQPVAWLVCAVRFALQMAVFLCELCRPRCLCWFQGTSGLDSRTVDCRTYGEHSALRGSFQTSTRRRHDVQAGAFWIHFFSFYHIRPCLLSQSKSSTIWSFLSAMTSCLAVASPSCMV